jgi:hypothetical protein
MQKLQNSIQKNPMVNKNLNTDRIGINDASSASGCCINQHSLITNLPLYKILIFCSALLNS